MIMVTTPQFNQFALLLLVLAISVAPQHPLQDGDVRIKFTFDDYENPPVDSTSSVHFDPTVVQLPPKDLTDTYTDVNRPLPPNSTIVRFPNRRPFPNTNGGATYSPPYDSPGGPYTNPKGPYDTSVTRYVPPYSTPSPTNQAEGRNFPLKPSSSRTTANNKIKSEDRHLDDDIKAKGTSTDTVNFFPEIRMLDREDFLSQGRGFTGEEFSLADGRRCLDKVELVETTAYDQEVVCEHREDKQCHDTLVTRYNSVQVEECKEAFTKTCYIQFLPTSTQEAIKVCKSPLVKDCSVSVSPQCKILSQAECWTKTKEDEVEEDVAECRQVQEQKCKERVSGYSSRQECTSLPRQICTISSKTVTKSQPVAGCRNEPIELCSKDGCGFSEGDPECREEKVTLIGEKPVEECQLEPRRVCKKVTRLVPYLEPEEECMLVPREVCTRGTPTPRKEDRPVVRRWCYRPE